MATNIYNRSGNLVGQMAFIDSSPNKGSENVVESGGVYDSVENAPDKTITTANKNLIDKQKAVKGTINTTTGEITDSDSYYVTDYIEVDTDRKYITAECDKFGAYNESKGFISVVSIQTSQYGDQSLVFPNNTKYIRLRIGVSGIDDAICADVMYYTKGETSGIEYTGFSDDTLQSAKKGIGEFAYNHPDCFSRTENQFDYEHDFIQVATRASGGGLLSNNGEFWYTNNTVAKDSDMLTNTGFAIDKYFPIEYGQMIVSNFRIEHAVFYDSQKAFLSASQDKEPYHGMYAPSSAKYVRVQLWGTNDSTRDDGYIKSLSQIKDIMIFIVDTGGQNDYYPKPWHFIPYHQIDGKEVSPNYLDIVKPNMIDSEWLSAVKCTAIRAVNERDDIFRFGNFNMWIMENIKGWNNVRRMLMDCGIDFCGFEECVVNEGISRHKGIAEFLKSWQFPYGFYSNWTDNEDPIDKSFVSRYPLASATKMTFQSASSNASYLNCKVNLPRYKDHYNPYRVLSLYIVHFPITDATTKIAVATELLGVIASDTSDFVIVFGDTNDFATKNYWQTLESGGFTPVIPTTTKTITQDTNFEEEDPDPDIWAKYCLDQFLVSSNITAKAYGVINTKDKYYIEDGYESSATDNEPALSDHDFVWVDLKFDYDTPRSNYPSSGE